MTKDELRQKIQELNTEVARLNALLESERAERSASKAAKVPRAQQRQEPSAE